METNSSGLIVEGTSAAHTTFISNISLDINFTGKKITNVAGIIYLC